MARRALTASLVLTPFAVVLAMQGCTQDFSTFDPTGAGGGDTPATTSGDPTTSTSTTTSGPGGGEGGSTTNGPGGGAGGPPDECDEPIDCEDDNPCTVDTCDGDTCVNDPGPDGPLDGDDETDCIDRACEGGVVVETPDDDEDPPDVVPVCDARVCEDGAVVPVLGDEGEECGNNLECDGDGLCVGCTGNPPNECGDPTDCSAPSCDVDTGTCDPGFVTDAPPDPEDGDCQALECPGDAADATVVNDDADVPADLPCSDRGCNAGQPTTPVRAEGMPCLAGATGVCDGVGTDAGACKTCRDTMAAGGTDAGCSAATPICNEGANGGMGECRECLADGTGCGNGLVCNPAGTGDCVTCYGAGDGAVDPGCDDDTPACLNNACVQCTAGADCTFADSAEGNACVDNACGCAPGGGNPDPDCVGVGNGPLCAADPGVCSCDDSGQCSNSPLGDDCLNGTPRVCGCNMDDDCEDDDAAGQACINGACGCADDDDCGAGDTCEGGVCVD